MPQIPGRGWPPALRPGPRRCLPLPDADRARVPLVLGCISCRKASCAGMFRAPYSARPAPSAGGLDGVGRTREPLPRGSAFPAAASFPRQRLSRGSAFCAAGRLGDGAFRRRSLPPAKPPLRLAPGSRDARRRDPRDRATSGGGASRSGSPRSSVSRGSLSRGSVSCGGASSDSALQRQCPSATVPLSSSALQLRCSSNGTSRQAAVRLEGTSPAPEMVRRFLVSPGWSRGEAPSSCNRRVLTSTAGFPHQPAGRGQWLDPVAQRGGSARGLSEGTLSRAAWPRAAEVRRAARPRQPRSGAP